MLLDLKNHDRQKYALTNKFSASAVEEKKIQERKRILLYLIANYLKEEGYESATFLINEAQLNNTYQVCDNIDLPTILQDFESYYYLRFQKMPKICKRVEKVGDATVLPKRLSKPHKKPEPKAKVKKENETSEPAENSAIQVTSLQSIHQEEPNKLKKTLKPLKYFKYQNPEWLEMAEMISKEICMAELDVHWDDVMGVDEAKNLLKESVVYPLKYPALFTGVLTPWKGLLLFGPPGTGKTLLAKAVATESKTTFFNISASTIVSKWRGDSEKLVRVLFDLARYYAPSTIFLDELDSLASKRDGMEHEASRRLQTELLIQLDGLAHSSEQVFLLATSNLPWELDPAMLRRLEKRILVDLPNSKAREKMLRYYLPPKLNTQPPIKCDIYYNFLAEEMKGYSGSDIKLICKEAAMAAVRGVFETLEDPKSNQTQTAIRNITTSDVQTALKKMQPSAYHLKEKFKEWTQKFGSQ